MRSRRNQNGFTLLELIVAIALSALVSLIGATALGAGADYYSRTEARLHHRVNVKAVERALRTEWAARGGSVQLSNDAVEFETTIPVSETPPLGVARVRYECQGNHTTGYRLTHQTWPKIKKPDDSALHAGTTLPSRDVRQGEVQRIDLLTGLRNCQFSALQSRMSESGRAVSKWVVLWDEKARAPQLLRLKLTGDFGDLPQFVFVAQRP